jgi:hypothetical protein
MNILALILTRFVKDIMPGTRFAPSSQQGGTNLLFRRTEAIIGIVVDWRSKPVLDKHDHELVSVMILHDGPLPEAQAILVEVANNLNFLINAY